MMSSRANYLIRSTFTSCSCGRKLSLTRCRATPFLCLTRRVSPPPASPPADMYAVSIVSLSPLLFVCAIFSPVMRTGAPRVARRRIGVAAVAVAATARREGGKGHVGYLAVPCESVCASYVARQSTRRLR